MEKIYTEYIPKDIIKIKKFVLYLSSLHTGWGLTFTCLVSCFTFSSDRVPYYNAFLHRSRSFALFTIKCSVLLDNFASWSTQRNGGTSPFALNSALMVTFSMDSSLLSHDMTRVSQNGITFNYKHRSLVLSSLSTNTSIPTRPLLSNPHCPRLASVSNYGEHQTLCQSSLFFWVFNSSLTV